MTSFDKNKAALFGLKVFVVEDELLLAVELVDELEALGAILVGPIPSLEEALAAVEQSEIDVAHFECTAAWSAVVSAGDVSCRATDSFSVRDGQRRLSSRALPECVCSPETL